MFAKIGFDIPHALRNLRGMRQADIIWTVLEWEWMGASFLQRLKLLKRKPLIGDNVFLSQEFSSMGRMQRFFYRFS